MRTTSSGFRAWEWPQVAVDVWLPPLGEGTAKNDTAVKINIKPLEGAMRFRNICEMDDEDWRQKLPPAKVSGYYFYSCCLIFRGGFPEPFEI